MRIGFNANPAYLFDIFKRICRDSELSTLCLQHASLLSFSKESLFILLPYPPLLPLFSVFPTFYLPYPSRFPPPFFSPVFLFRFLLFCIGSLWFLLTFFLLSSPLLFPHSEDHLEKYLCKEKKKMEMREIRFFYIILYYIFFLCTR